MRVIYATPSDVDYNPRYMTALATTFTDVQNWYADKLEGRTFQLHSPTPEHCELDGPSDRYSIAGGWDQVILDLEGCANILASPHTYGQLRGMIEAQPTWSYASNGVPHSRYYTWAVYVDAASDCKTSELGRGGPKRLTIMGREDLIGLANKEGNTNHCGYQRTQVSYLGGTAHELAHAFGLDHPPGCDDGLPTCDWDALMHLGYNNYPDTYFTEMDIERLNRNRFIRALETSQ